MQDESIQDKSDIFWENFEQYIAYWRENPHRFATEYLDVGLFTFQKVALYEMSHGSVFYFWASRGLGKTWLCALYVICACILYPGIKIRVASPSIKQSNNFIRKIQLFQREFPKIDSEIYDINLSKEWGVVRFHGGSECSTVVANDNARGERCQVLILDEGRLMNKAIVTTVLEPFLTEKRRPPYMNKPQYKKFSQQETNKEIFLSSIGTPDEWSYRDFFKSCEFIARGDKSYNVLSLPYQFGLESGIIDRAFIERQIREDKTDPQSFQMEMEVIPYGESEYSMFRFDELNNSRKLRIPLIPITNDEYVELNGEFRRSMFYRKMLPHETRIVVMDVAVSSAKNSDNTVFMVFSIFENRSNPDLPYYDKELSYIETMNGVDLDRQVLRLKQLFYDLECTYSVIDANAALGINVYDICAQVTPDYFRNIRYPAWKEMKISPSFDRPYAKDAESVLFGIKTSGIVGSDMQYSMLVKCKINLERGRIKLLSHEDDVEDELNKRFNFLSLKSSNDAFQTNRARNMIAPFANTTEFINEAIKTQVIRSQSGRIMFKEEKSTSRKDRVMTFMYGIHFISLIEDSIRVKVADQDYSSAYGGNKSQNVTKELFGGRKEIFGNRQSNPFKRR